MSNIELNCLVYGNTPAAKRIFPIEIARSRLVGSLKKQIIQEEQNTFKNIDASQLELWGVSIPLDGNADIMLRQLVLEDNEPKGIRNLLPARKLSTYFTDQPADNHIHIIVEAPIVTGLPSVLKRRLDLQDIAPKRRKFAAGAEAYQNFNFFIEPKILGVFGEYLLQRQFCLLFGHRQSGKTTICQALVRWFREHPEKFTELFGGHLDDFDIYVPTFDSSVITDQGPKVFWEAVCRKFRYLDPDRFVFNDPVMDSATFQGLFSKRAHPSSKPIILIIDEVSRLTSVGGTISEASKEVTDEFISTLRSLRNPHDYNLHSIALVGTESIRELLIAHNKPGASSQISPFTEEATWNAGRFTKAEVKQLFDQFAMDVANDKFESADISADIFDLTLGHKGLVGSCGTFIQRGYDNQGPPITTVDDWKKITTAELRNYISKKQHYESMMRSLEHLTLGCRSILTAVLRYGTHEVNLKQDATKYLIAEGLVSVRKEGDINSAIVECSAPILRSLMLSSIIVPTIRLSQEVPDEKKLDPRWLLARTIEHLCLRHLYAPQSLNAGEDQSEYAFQSEFSTIFRSLVPSAYPLLRYKTFVEVKERDDISKERKQRLDFLIRNGDDQPKFGFELAVAAGQTNFDKHCVRAEDYGRVHGCEMFMVNLCPKVTLCKYFGERLYKKVTPVNIVINPDEREGTIIYAGKDEHVLINGSDWDMVFDSKCCF